MSLIQPKKSENTGTKCCILLCNVTQRQRFYCLCSCSSTANCIFMNIKTQFILFVSQIIKRRHPNRFVNVPRLLLIFQSKQLTHISLTKSCFLQSSTWFPTKTQVKFVGDFTVKHVSEARGSHVTMTKLNLQTKVYFCIFDYLIDIHYRISTSTASTVFLLLKCNRNFERSQIFHLQIFSIIQTMLLAFNDI